jgi:polysaccharide export outer membrane protein
VEQEGNSLGEAAMKTFLRMLFGAFLFSLSACASLVEGSSQSITIATDPPAARCVLTRQGAVIAAVNPTPASVTVEKTRDDIVITCNKDGYKQASFVNHSGIAPAAYANALGAGIGLAIDAASGSDNKYDGFVNIPLIAEGPYRLDAGDVVRVIIYNQQSLSTDYKVGDNGTISLPLLGEVKARTLTVQELQKAIYDGLSNGIFVNPGVSVEISQYRPFFVVGEVSKPGQYPYTPGMNVLGAVAVAGGFTVRADNRHMTMIRKQQGNSSEASADPLTEVQPGDVIVVQERFF